MSMGQRKGFIVMSKFVTSKFNAEAYAPTYSPSWVTGSNRLCTLAGQAIKSVLSDISKLDLLSLGVSEYNRIYIENKLKKPHYEICVGSYMLGEYIGFLGDARGDAVLIDYGAGSGLAYFAAKRLGIGRVIYCDIFEQSCQDAKRIADALGIDLEAFICGDLADVNRCLTQRGLHASGLISHNVIEHVYDMDKLFRNIGELANRSVFVWLSTAANPFRRKTAAELSCHALRVENETREAAVGHKQRNALQAYKDIRRDIIREARTELDQDTVDVLAERTRGLNQTDIRDFLKNFHEGDTIDIVPSHPTNTCDPLTGNWAERMMDPFELTRDAQNYGLSLEVRPGLWSLDDGNVIKNSFKRVSNMMISLGKTKAMSRSPYYILCGTAVN